MCLRGHKEKNQINIVCNISIIYDIYNNKNYKKISKNYKRNKNNSIRNLRGDSMEITQNPRKYRNKEWLENQYIALEKSTRKIAKICKSNKNTILKWLRKFEIEVHSKSEINSGKFQKGHIPWHKGKTGVYSEERLKEMSETRKGTKLSEEIKRKMKESAHRDEDHYGWKGDDVGIAGLHVWIKKRKPKSEVCEICGKKEDKNGRMKLELSNITGEYKRDINDFQWVHHSCHVNYDIENGLWGNSHIDYKKRRGLIS